MSPPDCFHPLSLFLSLKHVCSGHICAARLIKNNMFADDVSVYFHKNVGGTVDVHVVTGDSSTKPGNI